MIMAIFFMIVIATLLTYMLATTSETAQRTTNDYLSEQGLLLAKSATEYTILRVSGVDRSGPDAIPGNGDDTCLQTFMAKYPDSVSPIFDIVVNINYFGFKNGCAPLFGNGISSIGSINTPESNGSMLIDVYVSDNPNLNLSEPIRYHRRTVQKL